VGGSGSQPKGRVTKTGQFARYSVRLLAYPFDGTCSVAPSDFGFTALETNRAGNVRADRFFTPDQVPAEIRNANHGVRGGHAERRRRLPDRLRGRGARLTD